MILQLHGPGCCGKPWAEVDVDVMVLANTGTVTFNYGPPSNRAWLVRLTPAQRRELRVEAQQVIAYDPDGDPLASWTVRGATGIDDGRVFLLPGDELTISLRHPVA